MNATRHLSDKGSEAEINGRAHTYLCIGCTLRGRNKYQTESLSAMLEIFFSSFCCLAEAKLETAHPQSSLDGRTNEESLRRVSVDMAKTGEQTKTMA